MAQQTSHSPARVTPAQQRPQRHLPRWKDLRPLIGGQPGTPKRTRLDRALTINDLRTLAIARTPRAVFDYVDGSAEEELSIARAREAFRALTFNPRVLRDVSTISTSTTILGRPASMPLILAPTGFTRMMHAAGETAVARAAFAAGIPYTLSTMGTTSVETLAARVPDVDRLFQLYVWKDRARSSELLQRAKASGYRAVVITVDVPVQGARLRDTRNGLTIPPRLTLRTMAAMSRYPRWWFNLLTSEPIAFATMSDSAADLTSIIQSMFDPSVTWSDLEWIRENWDGPIILKGIQSVADAVQAKAVGLEGIVLSNHGGRQLDRAPTSLELLAPTRKAVGEKFQIFIDTGIRSGADIAAAVALGADACMVGRAYLYGLMAGGEAGVTRSIEILQTDLTRTLGLLGAASLHELGPEHVALAS